MIVRRIRSLAAACAFALLAAHGTEPLSPSDAQKTFTIPDNLQWNVALAEPEITQPVFFNFDERGRMWVVEYRQYPYPAGLKVVSHDSVWRAVYDKTPLPPPLGVPGKDRISIHEDTDGDGVYDRHTVFIDNLNIATAVERGRGGVWVLNPPYLLFYPDANNDDVPDGPPQVHLQGFGLEDTHSVVNSLRWGPDGWLYAAQGSTVTGHVRRPDQPESEAVTTLGQNIWRYNPATRAYEVFAEGGGNAFHVELDAQGRIFSGHNGGDTRGFYYVQGGYLRKGFDKHGPLSNPYAFGYFPEMKHAQKVARFTHGFLKYEGGALPAEYNGHLFAIDPLNHTVFNTEITPQGAAFTTRDAGKLVTTTDPYFRPVDIKIGPDGAVYVADWYDAILSHVRNAEGGMDLARGRIYRLSAKDAKTFKPENMAAKSSADLIGALESANRWTRQTALRLLSERNDAAGILSPDKPAGPRPALTLELLWVQYQAGRFDEALALRALEENDPFVRLWTARLLCDARRVTPTLSGALASLAQRETNAEVRCQLAASARRLPVEDCLRIVRPLLNHAEDSGDPYIPLMLWWAVEAQCEKNAPQVLALLDDAQLWNAPLVRTHLLERLSRRLAAPGTPAALADCAALFQRAPDAESARHLLSGFEAAFEGRTLPPLPDALLRGMARAGAGSLLLDLRMGREGAVESALKALADAHEKPTRRIAIAQVLGDIKEARAVPVLLALVEADKLLPLRRAAITALQAFDGAEIAERLVALLPNLPPELGTAAQMALSARAAWTERLLGALESGAVKKETVAAEVVDALKQSDDAALRARIEKLWKAPIAVDDDTKAEIARVKTIVADGGNPKAGQAAFTLRCAGCHQLFGQGGHVGPDLTAFKRDDLDTMLLNIVNPSAEIREGFVNTLVKSADGRRLMGIVLQQNDATLTLRTADGQDVTLERAAVKSQKALGTSLMPEGLLTGLSDGELKDLFAFLRSAQPPK
jgi:putative heme-binding domain-containing protein